MNKNQQGRLGGGRDESPFNNRHDQSSSSYSLSQNDRMHLFMSASKQLAANTDRTFEKNAQIFKWLHNCKNARDSS